MKKYLLCSILLLTACNSSTPSMEEFCIKQAKDEGKSITKEMKAHCKCVQKNMIMTYGKEDVEKYVKTMSLGTKEGLDTALKSVKFTENKFKQMSAGFLQQSIVCAGVSGLLGEDAE